MPPTDVHDCAAPGCPIEVASYMLACRPHWHDLPQPLQVAISKAWNRRRRDPDNQVATARHLELVQDAFAIWAGATIMAKL